MILKPKTLTATNGSNKIPHDVLYNILAVYEHGSKDDLPKLPNTLICQQNGDFWTTWDEVFKIKERLKKEMQMNAKKEAIKLIDEIRDAVDNQLDGYFDGGKAIALAILKNDYTIQQKTRIVDALKNLTLEEYEPD